MSAISNYIFLNEMFVNKYALNTNTICIKKKLEKQTEVNNFIADFFVSFFPLSFFMKLPWEFKAFSYKIEMYAGIKFLD